LYSIVSCTLTIKESIIELKSLPLSGCWKELKPGTVDDFQILFHQQDNKKGHPLISLEKVSQILRRLISRKFLTLLLLS
jgi:hypothetical protein